MGYQIEKNEMGRTCSAMGERRSVYRVLVEKPKGKRQLWRTRRRWKVNIKMDLQEVGCGVTDWIELAHDMDKWRGACDCGNELSGSIKCGEFLG